MEPKGEASGGGPLVNHLNMKIDQEIASILNTVLRIMTDLKTLLRYRNLKIQSRINENHMTFSVHTLSTEHF